MTFGLTLVAVRVKKCGAFKRSNDGGYAVRCPNISRKLGRGKRNLPAVAAGVHHRPRIALELLARHRRFPEVDELIAVRPNEISNSLHRVPLGCLSCQDLTVRAIGSKDCVAN